jgi:hypothetical protein
MSSRTQRSGTRPGTKAVSRHGDASPEPGDARETYSARRRESRSSGGWTNVVGARAYGQLPADLWAPEPSDLLSGATTLLAKLPWSNSEMPAECATKGTRVSESVPQRDVGDRGPVQGI